MKVMIVTDIRLLCYKDRYYVHNAVSTILYRYAKKFGKIDIFSRRINLNSLEDETLYDITDILDNIITVNSFIDCKKKNVKEKIFKHMKKADLIILRTPSILSVFAQNITRKLNKPYFAEAMGDAWDAYWNHSLSGKILAPYMHLKNKSIFKNASYALYVTNEYLQKKYPCSCESVSASNVFIQETPQDILKKRIERISHMNLKEITLMTTAGVNVRAKGHRYVIEAMTKMMKKGIIVNYILVGGGDQSYLKNLANKNGVGDRVIFKGELSHEQVFETLDKIDIYIQPSLQEGLPRSVIEAMSRACPCLGARTAGTPELISESCVFKRRSNQDIVDKLFNNLTKERLLELSKENFENAKNYTNNRLNEKRNEYYNKIKKDFNTL